MSSGYKSLEESAWRSILDGMTDYKKAVHSICLTYRNALKAAKNEAAKYKNEDEIYSQEKKKALDSARTKLRSEKQTLRNGLKHGATSIRQLADSLCACGTLDDQVVDVISAYNAAGAKLPLPVLQKYADQNATCGIMIPIIAAAARNAGYEMSVPSFDGLMELAAEIDVLAEDDPIVSDELDAELLEIQPYYNHKNVQYKTAVWNITAGTADYNSKMKRYQSMVGTIVPDKVTLKPIEEEHDAAVELAQKMADREKATREHVQALKDDVKAKGGIIG